MEQKFTLFELNERIREVLLETFPSAVWVVAEISELKENRSGHCYLELIEKDGSDIIARSRATIWSYTYRMLKPYFESTTGRMFTHGIKILVQASVEYHPAYGLSLNIKDIDPVYTVGDLALQRKEIIARLQANGIFDMNRDLPLPLVPQKIAVISSKTAAGYQDFMSHLENNEHGFRFYTKLFEASMQGSDAVPSIIGVLEKIFRYDDFFDAVAIIRGGGATADLSCFDNYELAFNITQFPLPVVTGIGHEKDDTIIDLVAHTRLKTPTAVAGFFIAGVERFYEQLLEMESEIIRLTREIISEQNEWIGQCAKSLNSALSAFIREKNIQLIRKGNSLQQKVNRFSYHKNYELVTMKNKLESVLSVLKVETVNKIDRKKRILKRLSGEILLKENAEILNRETALRNLTVRKLTKEGERIRLNENAMRLLRPENVLKRGYTLSLKEGQIVKSVNELEVGETIETRFADGKTESKITKKL